MDYSKRTEARAVAMDKTPSIIEIIRISA